MSDTQAPDAATRVALVTALLVAAFLVVAILVSTVSNIVVSLAYDGSNLTYASTLVQGIAEQLFRVVLPAAVGVFLGFRVIAPITAQLPLRAAILRGVVTTGIVALLTFAIALLAIIATTVTNNIFGNSFPLEQFGGALSQVFASLPTILSTFLERLPLVVLAAVLLWLWLGAKRRATSV